MTEQEMLLLREKIGVRQPGVDYNVLVDGHGTGLAPPTEEEWQNMVGHQRVFDEDQAPPSLPMSYNLSSQSYFPKVGNQGGQGSCAAWAATYYCYGYLEAKDNDWTDAKAGTNASHLMSPAWTYNRVNSGGDHGSWMSDNFQVIMDWGVPSLATMPYNDGDPLSWGGPAAYREAPLHRAASYTTDYFINGNAAINEIKTWVSSNTPVSFTLDAYQYSGHLGDSILTAAEYQSSTYNHANTFVGYDDNVSVGAEHGAFKVVNSWGTGFGSGGYYWLTYDAVKEIANSTNLWLTTVTDKPDYSPAMLAVWHFNSAPSRTGYIQLGIGSHSSPLYSRTASYDPDTDMNVSTFMCLDISEFKPYFDSGTTNIWLEMRNGGAGTLSSFRIETYDSTYVPGKASTASAQSPDIPKIMPGYATVSFAKYAPISPNQALDADGPSFSSSGQAKWVGVNHQSYFGGDSMQSGDVSDSAYSSLQTTVSGVSGVSFYWKVSSEASNDLLRFYVDGSMKSSVSGQVDWQKVTFNLSSGSHLLAWNYSRDSTNSGNKDMGWLDRVVMIPHDDSYEENDNASKASTLAPTGTYNGLVGLDDDWYRLNVEVDDKLTARMDLNASQGDLDLYLYGPDATTSIDISATSGSSEEVEVLAPSSGYYYLRVQPDPGQFSTYSLTFTYESGALDYGKNSSLAIVSGTGDFASIAGKRISAVVGSTLSGTISFHADVTWKASEQVPLIGTSNWGSPAASFFEAAPDLATGSSDATASVTFTLPSVPGDYYLIFAFRNESSAGHVASATDDAVGAPVWGDGNDIAALTSVQINESRSTGRTLGDWLRIDGMHAVRIPSDALLINVTPPDTSPPETSSSFAGTLGSGGWYRSSVTVTLSAVDSGSGVGSTSYRLNGGAWTTYSAPFTVDSQGTNAVDYFSTDNSGNSEAPKEVSVSIDLAAPTTTVSASGPQGGAGWYVSAVTVTFTGSDGFSGLQSIFYRLDGGAWIRYQSAVTIQSDGRHQLDFFSTDIAGNSESARHIFISLDGSAPISSATFQGVEGSSGWYLGPVEVTLLANDSLSGTEAQYYNLDGAGWLEYQAPIDVSSVGMHQLEFNSTDWAGNAEAIQVIGFGIDSTPPECSASVNGTPGNDGWYVSSIEVELNASDAISGVHLIQYALDAGQWQNYTSPLTISSPGSHSLLFRSEDVAGNVQEATELILQVDDSAPSCGLDLSGIAGGNGWFLSEVVLIPNGSDQGSGIDSYHYRMDSGDWSTLTGNLTINAEGAHVIESYAVDKAGNVGPTISRQVWIDTAPPSSSIAFNGTQGSEGWFVSNVSIDIAAMDAPSGVESIFYSISGGEWLPYTGSITIDVEGIYEIRYHAIDIAGNVEAISSRQLMVELSAPSSLLSIQGTEGRDGWYISRVIADITAADPMSGVSNTYYRLDGSKWQESMGPIEVGQGQHSLEYYSVDHAGNQEGISSADVWVDVIAPQTRIEAQGSLMPSGWYVSEVSVGLAPADDISGVRATFYQVDGGIWMNYTGPIALPTEGVHKLSCFSSDLAGNEGSVSNLTIEIDMSPPETSLEFEGASGLNGWYVSAVNLTISSQDAISGSQETTWSLDGGAWSTYEGKASVDAPGLHVLDYRSKDRAGNLEPVRHTAFKIDTDRPALKLNGTGKPFTTKDVSLRFDAQDNDSEVLMIKVRVDGGPESTISQSPWALGEGGLSDGWHDLEVTVYDEAGNSLDQTIKFKVDTNPLSPEGPYGPWLLMLIAILAICAIVIVVVWKRKRR
ncbi:MAG TPA: Ig-like domain-containing protein [Methanomassiliicoccales archaeon]|nr:Ig-like domain-containing protein [Methanomassiliicoccales archaeon]